MLLLLALVAGLEGLGWSHPLQAIGARTAGAGVDGGPTAVALGALLHLLASAGLGLLFAALLPDDFPIPSAIAAGGGFGLFAAGFMMTVVAPAVSPELRSAVQPVGGSWVNGHVLFGCVLGAVLSALRRGPGSRPTRLAGTMPGRGP